MTPVYLIDYPHVRHRSVQKEKPTVTGLVTTIRFSKSTPGHPGVENECTRGRSPKESNSKPPLGPYPEVNSISTRVI